MLLSFRGKIKMAKHERVGLSPVMSSLKTCVGVAIAAIVVGVAIVIGVV